MKKSFVLSLLATAVFATAARADVVYDNVTVNPVYGTSGGTSVGQSFVTGGTPLRFADFLFPQLDGTAATGYFNNYTAGETVNLYANNPLDNTPVTTLSLATFTLQNVATGSAQGQTTATPTLPTILAANTRYWLVLAAPNATSRVVWDFADYDTANPGYYKFNSALGVTLPLMNSAFESDGTTTTFFDYTDGPQMLYLEAFAVPEPSTYALLALGGLGALLLVRRARTAKAA